jgi:ABC-type molybdate transport system substrate-binding protein
MLRFIFAIMLFLACPPAVAQEVAARTDSKTNLTVLVDDNLLLPLTRLARLYAITDGTPLTIVVKNTEEAEMQIEQGLEAHVMLTENQALISRLTEQGLTDVNATRPIARTQLALVAHREHGKQAGIAKRISFAATLYATPDIPVFLDTPDSIAGLRAVKLLEGYEFSENLAARAEVKENHDDLVDAVRAREGLGLMLAADAVAQPELAVLSLLPDDAGTGVTYDAVVLASETMDEAKRFMQFLASRQAQEVFAHFGFQSPAN